jgi:peptide deformylase
MYHYNGIGLAAPQVGISKRIFVACEFVPDRPEDNDETPPTTIEEKRQRWGIAREHFIVNPKITKRDGTQYGPDGCLSVPGLLIEEMKRDDEIHVTYQDVEGRTHELVAKGRFAHVIQHEYDHLEGILFFNRLPEEERRAFVDKHREELAEMQREAKAFLRELKENPKANIVVESQG